MIQTLPCPSCKTITLLRESLSPETRIRCPHCHTEFVLQELLSSQLGSWEVVDEPAGTSSGTLAAAQPLSSADEAGDFTPRSEGLLHRVTGAEAAQRLELKLQEPTTAPLKKTTNWSNFEPITHDQYERLKRKSRSPLWSVLQVVLGGVAAVPIALLLVWHLIGTDVGDAGPLVGQYVPWIVPERFRPLPPREELTPAVAARAPERGASGFRQFDEVLPMKVSEADVAESPGSSAAPATASDSTTTGTMPSASATTSGSGDQPGNAIDAGDPLLNAELQQAPVQNVFALIRQCQQHLDEWSAAVRDQASDLKTPAQRVYGDLTSLANVIQALPSENPVLRIIRNEMQPIGRTVKRLEDVQSLIEQGARFWVRSHSQSENYGLAMIIVIETAREVGDGWQVTPTAATSLGDPALRIDVPRELAPLLMPGQRLLLLGTVHPPVATNAPTQSAGTESKPLDTTTAADSGSPQDEQAPSQDEPVVDLDEPPNGVEPSGQVDEDSQSPRPSSPPVAESSAPNGPQFTASYLHAL